MQFRRQRRPVETLELTPLIDVIFQLLIFFLITTTFSTSPGMSIQRPKAKNGGPLEQERFTVMIPKEATDAVVFQGERLNYQEFQNKLRALYKKRPQTQIAIDADKDVEHQIVVKVMDIVSGVGFQRLGIVTNPVPIPPR